LDGYVLAAGEGFGIQVVDVDPPGQTSIVATVPTPSFAHSVDVVGSIALSVETFSWRLVDVSNPAAPSVTYGVDSGTVGRTSGTFDRRTSIQGGAASGPDVAYIGWIAGYDTEIAIIDVSDPHSPSSIGHVVFPFDIPRSVRYVEQTLNGVPRSYIYVAGDDFYIIDVNDPSSPSTVVAYNLSARDVTGADGFAYAAVGGSIRVLDVSDPSQPTSVGLLAVPGDPQDVWLMGSDLFVSSESRGVHVVDVRDPKQPTIKQTIYTPLHSNQARALGTDLFVADGSRGIHVFDVTALDPVPTVTTVDTPGEALKIELMGDHAYVADGESGLQIFDIQDLGAPSLVGSLAPQISGNGYEFVDVKVSGQTAYVAGRTDGFHIIDVSNPAQPSYLSSPMAYANAVDVAGDLAYVTYSVVTAGLTILDVSIGTAPSIVGTLSLPPNLTTHVTVIEDVLYVSSWNHGLWTIDVSDPATPVQVGALPGNYLGLVPAADDLAYAVSYHQEYEVQVLDLSDPFQPHIVGRVQAGVNPRDLYLDGDVLYVACGRMGVHAIDVTDPLQPVNFGNVLPENLPGVNPAGAIDVYVRGDRLLVASGEEGIAVLPAACPSSVGAPVDGVSLHEFRVTAAPNPFRNTIDLGFTMDRSSAVRVDVHDVRGRLIRHLVNGRRSAGRHSISWNGQDATGQPAAAGVYFVRAERGGKIRTEKIVLLR
jgi:hypothetical protein